MRLSSIFSLALTLSFLSIPINARAQQQTYTIHRIAGGGLPQNIPATSLGIGSPTGIAVDGAGRVYIALGAYAMVVRLDTNGMLTVVAGDGIPGYGGDGGLATNAELYLPAGLALDKAGNLYISEYLNCTVRKVTNGIISTVAGMVRNCGNSGDAGPATSATLNGPTGIAVDDQGALYISDTNWLEVRKVSDGIITTFAGGGLSSADGIPATAGAIIAPAGLAIDSAGDLYIAEFTSGCVRKVSHGLIYTVVAACNGDNYYDGDGGLATAAHLNGPLGLAFDNAGDLFIEDAGNNLIRKVSGGIITTFAGNGIQGDSGDGGLATRASFQFTIAPCDPSGDCYSAPYGAIGVDPAGKLIIADIWNYVVREVSPQTGRVTRIVGNGSLGYESAADTASGAPGLNTQLAFPTGIAVSPGGDLYIADPGSSRVWRVSNGTITRFAGNGTQGESGDGGAAIDTQLNWPVSLAVDSMGNVYIGEAGYENGFNGGLAHCRVRVVSNGVISTVAGDGRSENTGDGGAAPGAGIGVPGGLAFDQTGVLYIAAGDRVRKISNGIITSVAGGGGPPPGTIGDGGLATNAVVYATSVAVDTAGNLYIVDTNPGSICSAPPCSMLIRKIANGIIKTVAGGGAAPNAVPASVGDYGPATSAFLCDTSSVVADASGNLYIADTCDGFLGSRVRKVSAGLITSIAGGGLSYDGQALAANLNVPMSLAIDNSGGLYISDTYDYVVSALVPDADSSTGIVEFDILSAASYATGSFAAESLASLYGQNLATGTVSAASLPLPTSLAGVRVAVVDSTFIPRTAPLLYADENQVNFEIPAGTVQGPAYVQVTLSDGSVTATPIGITSISPGIFSLNDSGLAAAWVLRVSADGTQSLEPVYEVQNGVVVPKPIDLGPVTDRVYLEIYGTGIRGASEVNDSVSVTMGGVSAVVSYAGPQGTLVGVDQVNAEIPRSLAGAGEISVVLSPGPSYNPSYAVQSNVVHISIL
jgi:uncharacterized protein (TIGR03437 family)